jgi:transposase-like protein
MAAMHEEGTIAEILSKYGIHASQVVAWKKTFQDGCRAIWGSDESSNCACVLQRQLSVLHEKVEQLFNERNFFGSGLRR